MTPKEILERLDGYAETARHLDIHNDNVSVTVWHHEIDHLLALPQILDDPRWEKLRECRTIHAQEPYGQYPPLYLRQMANLLLDQPKPKPSKKDV